MVFLINCSNLKVSGGLQVADSICGQLDRHQEHRFVVVLSSELLGTAEKLKGTANVSTHIYNVKNNFSTLVLGRDTFLDGLVETEHVDAVLTVFGPSRWQPKCPHLCGFARAHLVLKDSPFMKHIPLTDRIQYAVWSYYFKRSSNIFYTENPYISKKLHQLLGPDVEVFTVTNYYHQVYETPSEWKCSVTLPPFNGITVITITSNQTHKNLPIMNAVCAYFENVYPTFEFRFLLTLTEEQCTFLEEKYKRYFVFLGKVDISECPNLYRQADIMFMPTLLECFTATYPEAMKMEIPIVTTDLNFAHGLCGDAACYYSPLDGDAAAEAIHRVAIDSRYARQLIENGKRQLNHFDDYKQRTDKLIHILEEIAK